ncbi:hypothetical protein Rs2_02529 [Raphanus sativus]|nr:hypothetical protein Rs2_02529 [Raphanus sativus]
MDEKLSFIDNLIIEFQSANSYLISPRINQTQNPNRINHLKSKEESLACRRHSSSCILIREDIELNTEDVVGRVAVVGQVEETQVLSGASSVDSGGGRKEEDEALAGEDNVFGNSHGQDEGSGERENRGATQIPCCQLF